MVYYRDVQRTPKRLRHHWQQFGTDNTIVMIKSLILSMLISSRNPESRLAGAKKVVY